MQAGHGRESHKSTTDLPPTLRLSQQEEWRLLASRPQTKVCPDKRPQAHQQPSPRAPGPALPGPDASPAHGLRPSVLTSVLPGARLAPGHLAGRVRQPQRHEPDSLSTPVLPAALRCTTGRLAFKALKPSKSVYEPTCSNSSGEKTRICLLACYSDHTPSLPGCTARVKRSPSVRQSVRPSAAHKTQMLWP